MRLKVLSVFFVLIGIASLFIVFYDKGTEITAYQNEIAAIGAKQRAVESEIANLESLLSRKDDRDYLEFLVRRELGLIMPGEEKFIIIEAGP